MVIDCGSWCIWLQQLGDTTPQVRDASAEAFATVWKVMGDRPMTAYLEGIDKTKMTKVSSNHKYFY